MYNNVDPRITQALETTMNTLNTAESMVFCSASAVEKEIEGSPDSIEKITSTLENAQNLIKDAKIQLKDLSEYIAIFKCGK